MIGSKKKALVGVVVLAVVVFAGALMALNGSRSTAPGREQSVKPVAYVNVEEASFASTASYDKMVLENAGVKASIQPYTLKPDLSNVSNLKVFKDILEPQMIKMIATNGFAVTPTDYIQMFHVYENNEYQRPEKYPSFITVDSMLHTYHVFYDYTLREIESYKLYDAAVKLSDAMLKASQEDYAAIRDPQLKDAALRNVAYFAVGRNLLSGSPAPAAAKAMADADLVKISEHGGWSESAVTEVSMDFSQFVPRGHYTRTEKLKKYFRAMMYYGLSPLPLSSDKTDSGPTMQALLMVKNLRTASSGSTPAAKLWDTIYEPTAFYVGTADDYTFYQYAKVMDKVYGKNPALEALASETKFDEFAGEVKKLPGPGIDNATADGKSVGGRQFRFMGQRFIPDSRIFRQLTHEYVAFRGFPKGLDAFAAMGSDRALTLLKQHYDVEKFGGYNSQMAKMREEMKNTPQVKWQSNLYYGWLWSLQSVVEPAPAGYPSFMRNTAWVDKSLFTALGSWTELRHDTILYAKQSVAECGGGDIEEEPPTPKGYVEPNLEFWTRLKWLNQHTMEGLTGRGLLTEELKDKFTKMDDWLTFCRNITIKELTGKKVTEEEYNQICFYGAELEQLTQSFAGGELVSDTDKDMAVVADVHTADGSCLEEATGRAATIYVVVPIEGKLYLTRGAVYTHYEFDWPISDRLTDEKWQKMLQSGKTPTMAEWIKSFFIDTKKKPALEFEAFTSGC